MMYKSNKETLGSTHSLASASAMAPSMYLVDDFIGLIRALPEGMPRIMLGVITRSERSLTGLKFLPVVKSPTPQETSRCSDRTIPFGESLSSTTVAACLYAVGTLSRSRDLTYEMECAGHVSRYYFESRQHFVTMYRSLR